MTQRGLSAFALCLPLPLNIKAGTPPSTRDPSGRNTQRHVEEIVGLAG